MNAGSGGRPGPNLRRLTRQVNVTTVTVLLLLAAGGWAVTIRQASAMNSMVGGLAQIGTRMPNGMSIPIFMGMWLAMMVAMMFPTIAPFVLAHRVVVQRRGEGNIATVTFVAGYLFVWAAIGLVPLAAFLAFRNYDPMAGVPSWTHLVAGVVLLGAGLYQFTSLKTACLTACRTPFDFLVSHDFGSGNRGAFRAGITHGAYCLGCCWALMSVLVVVGLMNLVWMALLAVVFLGEKNSRHGVSLSRVAGGATALVGFGILIHPSALQSLPFL